MASEKYGMLVIPSYGTLPEQYTQSAISHIINDVFLDKNLWKLYSANGFFTTSSYISFYSDCSAFIIGNSGDSISSSSCLNLALSFSNPFFR